MNKKLALKISKHPLIKKLMEDRTIPKSVIARLIVEELEEQNQPMYDLSQGKIDKEGEYAEKFKKGLKQNTQQGEQSKSSEQQFRAKKLIHNITKAKDIKEWLLRFEISIDAFQAAYPEYWKKRGDHKKYIKEYEKSVKDQLEDEALKAMFQDENQRQKLVDRIKLLNNNTTSFGVKGGREALIASLTQKMLDFWDNEPSGEPEATKKPELSKVKPDLLKNLDTAISKNGDDELKQIYQKFLETLETGDSSKINFDGLISNVASQVNNKKLKTAKNKLSDAIKNMTGEQTEETESTEIQPLLQTLANFLLNSGALNESLEALFKALRPKDKKRFGDSFGKNFRPHEIKALKQHFEKKENILAFLEKYFENNTEKDQIIKNVEKILSGEKLEPSEPSKEPDATGEPASDKTDNNEDPEKFDVDPEALQDLIRVSEEFIEDFYEKALLRDQGKLVRKVLDQLVKITEKEELEKAAQRRPQPKPEEGEQVQEQQQNPSALRNIQVDLKSFIKLAKSSKEVLQRFDEASEKGKVIGSSLKKKFMEMLAQLQENIRDLVQDISKLNLVQEAKDTSEIEKKWDAIEKGYNDASRALSNIIAAGSEEKEAFDMENNVKDAYNALMSISHFFPSVNPFGKKTSQDMKKYSEQYGAAIKDVKSVLRDVLELSQGQGGRSTASNAIKALKEFSGQIQSIFDVKSKFDDVIVQPNERAAQGEPQPQVEKEKSYAYILTHKVLSFLGGLISKGKNERDIQSDIERQEEFEPEEKEAATDLVEEYGLVDLQQKAKMTPEEMQLYIQLLIALKEEGIVELNESAQAKEIFSKIKNVINDKFPQDKETLLDILKKEGVISHLQSILKGSEKPPEVEAEWEDDETKPENEDVELSDDEAGEYIDKLDNELGLGEPQAPDEEPKSTSSEEDDFSKIFKMYEDTGRDFTREEVKVLEKLAQFVTSRQNLQEQYFNVNKALRLLTGITAEDKISMFENFVKTLEDDEKEYLKSALIKINFEGDTWEFNKFFRKRMSSQQSSNAEEDEKEEPDEAGKEEPETEEDEKNQKLKDIKLIRGLNDGAEVFHQYRLVNQLEKQMKETRFELDEAQVIGRFYEYIHIHSGLVLENQEVFELVPTGIIPDENVKRFIKQLTGDQQKAFKRALEKIKDNNQQENFAKIMKQKPEEYIVDGEFVPHSNLQKPTKKEPKDTGEENKKSSEIQKAIKSDFKDVKEENPNASKEEIFQITTDKFMQRDAVEKAIVQSSEPKKKEDEIKTTVSQELLDLFRAPKPKRKPFIERLFAMMDKFATGESQKETIEYLKKENITKESDMEKKQYLISQAGFIYSYAALEAFEDGKFKIFEGPTNAGLQAFKDLIFEEAAGALGIEVPKVLPLESIIDYTSGTKEDYYDVYTDYNSISIPDDIYGTLNNAVVGDDVINWNSPYTQAHAHKSIISPYYYKDQIEPYKTARDLVGLIYDLRDGKWGALGVKDDPENRKGK